MKVIEYCITLGLCVLCIMNVRWYIMSNRMDLVSFFGMALFFLSLLIIKDFLDLCWIKTLITEHVFRHDIDNYIFDEKKLHAIKHDIMTTRKLQVEHGREVDISDPQIQLLFDDTYSEDNIKKIEVGALSPRKPSQTLELPKFSH